MTASPFATAYFLFVAALLGLVMGSFINCWAWRYMNGESVLKGRSHCTTCGHELGLLDLVPVFSWVASKGRCRHCGDRVSARYPATELVCGAVFVGIVAVYGLSLETLELLGFAGVLLFLSLTDIDDYLIPNGCIITAIAIRVAYLGITFALGTTSVDQLLYYAASGFGMGIALVIIVVIADFVFGRDSMGGGDLKLYFVAGLYFGWQQCLLLVIISCIIGIVVAFVGARPNASPQARPVEADASGDAGEPEGDEDSESAGGAEGPADSKHDEEPESVLKRTIPFGPSIAAACILVMLAGQPIIDWYTSFLL